MGTGDRDPLLNHWGMEWCLYRHLMFAHASAFTHECQQCGIENMVIPSKFVGRQERPQKQPEEKWQDDLFVGDIQLHSSGVRA